ncbi:LuxR family transcriptional regulator [Roseibium aquae]|nr:LuxR family transcriptional regulator [Roseibium aquae]
MTDSITAETDLDALGDSLSALASSFGFAAFVLASFRGNGSPTNPHIMTTTWNEEWKARYLSKSYILNDPVVAFGATTRRPFLWSECLAQPGVTAEGLRILHEAETFNMADGVFVPIYGPTGFEGTVTFAGLTETLGPHDLKALHLTSIYAYGQAIRLTATSDETPGAGTNLTRRERECLKWSAAGQTSSDIADKLGISRHTADWYLKEATRKLGALNRTHAVALAYQQGVIS